jgi:hypothetical protein
MICILKNYNNIYTIVKRAEDRGDSVSQIDNVHGLSYSHSRLAHTIPTRTQSPWVGFLCLIEAGSDKTSSGLLKHTELNTVFQVEHSSLSLSLLFNCKCVGYSHPGPGPPLPLHVDYWWSGITFTRFFPS